MKIALITDTHAGARGDSPLFAEMQAKFYTDVFFPELVKRDIDDIIHLGDYFDRRRFINFSSLAANYESFVKPAKTYNVHLIVGNHDTYYRSTNSINSPMLLLDRHWNIYEERDTLVLSDGFRVAMVPWINPENKADTLQWLKEVDVDMVAGHFEFAGFEMHKGTVSKDGQDPEEFIQHPIIISGHFHTQSEKGNIKYLGSAFEFTWSDCDDPRGFHIFDTETKEFEFIQNPYKMFFKVVYDGSQSADDYEHIKDKFVKVIVTEEDPKKVDKFIRGLHAHHPHDLQVIDQAIEQDVKHASVDVDINTEVKTHSVIQEVVQDTELNESVKARVSKLLNEIYMEALEE